MYPAEQTSQPDVGSGCLWGERALAVSIVKHFSTKFLVYLVYESAFLTVLPRKFGLEMKRMIGDLKRDFLKCWCVNNLLFLVPHNLVNLRLGAERKLRICFFNLSCYLSSTFKIRRYVLCLAFRKGHRAQNSGKIFCTLPSRADFIGRVLKGRHFSPAACTI